MKLFYRFFFLVVSVFAAYGMPAQALEPSTPVAAYRHDLFDARAGAPRNAVAMAQTANGWLWFGTPTGLYRYDGVRFESFQPMQGQRLLGQYITTLMAHPNGDLWIGYLYGGLSVLHDGQLRHLQAPSGKPVAVAAGFAVEGDDVWVAASAGLFRYRAGRWQRFGADQGFSDDPARAIYLDHYGRLWAADSGQVYLLDRSTRRFARLLKIKADPVLTASPDGRVWAADGIDVHLLPAPPGGWRALPPSRVHHNAAQVLFDRHGNYWVGNCPVGMCVVRPAHQAATSDGFLDPSGKAAPHDGRVGKVMVASTLEDNEGNIWFATPAGVERLRDTRLVSLVLPPASGWPSMALDAAGTTWIVSTNMGLTGRLWKVEDGRPVEQRTGQLNAVVTQGRNGSVLVAGEHWLERRLGERVLARYPMPASIRGQLARDKALLLGEDRDGIWLYQSGRGLLRRRGGAWETVPAQARLSRVIYVFVDEAGRAWFGTRDNGVVMLDGERRRDYGAGDGIALGAVTFVDASRELVISGDNGSAIWQGGRFRPLRAEGADLSNVSGLAVTGEGDRWLNTKRGLLHVKAADWQRSMADPAAPLRGRLLDELDGFPGEGNANSPVSTLRVGTDGRLWISGTDGVSVLDPARTRGNMPAPHAQILGFVADGRSYRTGPPQLLAPRTERLRFDFTAPSLAMPERVRFRYRLSGFDHGWLDAGTARSASYTNLAPGAYRFEVQAMSEDGRPGPVASTAPFRIAPAFYQTLWFIALCALLAGTLAWLLYRWRLGRIQRDWQSRMDARVSERERIARTLHDTFLQSLHGLILQFDAIAVSLPPGSTQRVRMEHLLGVASRVSQEGRSQVMDLRTQMTPTDLRAAIMASIEELRSDRSVEVSVEQTGEPRDLSLEVGQEVEALAREAIANVFRHAKARHLEVAIDWTGRAMVLTIIDDGVGIHPRFLKHGRSGHWGLRGMRERAARIGASLALRNRNGGGLEVRLDLGGSWLTGSAGSRTCRRP